MRVSPQQPEMNDLTAVDHPEVVFFSEDQIAESTGEKEWVNGCGHDCCTCDRECK